MNNNESIVVGMFKAAGNDNRLCLRQMLHISQKNGNVEILSI